MQEVPCGGVADGLSRFEHELFMSFPGRALEHGTISLTRLIIKFSISTHSIIDNENKKGSLFFVVC